MEKKHEDIQHVLKHFYRVPVETVMHKDVWNLPIADENTPIEHIFSIMTARRHVWITDKKGSTKLKGIITEKDLLEIMMPHKIKPYMIGGYSLNSLILGNVATAKDVMVKKVISCHPNDSIEDVLEKMRSFQIRRLPVVDKSGNLVGELTIKTVIIQFRKILNWYRITKNENSQSKP